MKGWPSYCPKSQTVHMLGWSREEAARASRSKRSRAWDLWPGLQKGTSTRVASQACVLSLVNYTHASAAQSADDTVV